MASGKRKSAMPQTGEYSDEMKMMVAAVGEIVEELIKGSHRPWGIEIIKRNRQFIEWTTGIGLVMLTIVFPLLLTSGQVKKMAMPVRWLICFGSLLVVISVGLGLAFSLMFHNEVMTEVYLELLNRIESLKNPLVARIHETISEPKSFEWKSPDHEFAEHLFRIIADPSSFENEMVKVEKKAQPIYALHVISFTLGVALIVIPLFIYFTQVLL